MKKYGVVLLAILVFLAVPVSMVSAKGGQQTGSDSDITVAGIVFLEDQFMRLLTIGYQDAARDAGVRFLTGNSSNDQAKEVELVNTYISQNVHGLAIAPLSPTTTVALLQRASESGMKVAVADSTLKAPFIVGGYASDPTNLGASTGKAAAKFIKEKLGGKAKIAVVQYKSLFSEISAARVNGFLDEVRKVNPDVEVVADQDAWMQDTALQTVGNILTANPEVNIVYGANDGGTIGAVMAVKNAGFAGKVFVFGIDVGEQQIIMLRDNDNILQAVTGQDPYSIGYSAMKTVIDAINGKDTSATSGKTTIVPGTLVSRDDPTGINRFEENLKVRMSK
jgi:simple sugar transport system substrate-binding protein/ribose transport system substrate-binding protein